LSEGGKLAQTLGPQMQDAVALFGGLAPWQSKTLLRCLAARGIHSDSVLYI
jgi:hypothetical protein